MRPRDDSRKPAYNIEWMGRRKGNLPVENQQKQKKLTVSVKEANEAKGAGGNANGR